MFSQTPKSKKAGCRWPQLSSTDRAAERAVQPVSSTSSIYAYYLLYSISDLYGAKRTSTPSTGYAYGLRRTALDSAPRESVNIQHQCFLPVAYFRRKVSPTHTGTGDFSIKSLVTSEADRTDVGGSRAGGAWDLPPYQRAAACDDSPFTNKRQNRLPVVS